MAKVAAKKAAEKEKEPETPKKAAAKKSPKKAAEKEAEAPKKAPAKKAAAKKAAAKSADKSSDDGGKSVSGLKKPLSVSNELAEIVGKEPMPRTEILKKMWDYIKANDLQNKENRRMIDGDKKLKVVFDGKDQVSMFELAKVINNHIKQ